MVDYKRIRCLFKIIVCKIFAVMNKNDLCLKQMHPFIFYKSTSRKNSFNYSRCKTSQYSKFTSIYYIFQICQICVFLGSTLGSCCNQVAQIYNYFFCKNSFYLRMVLIFDKDVHTCF